jgi:hypothetical protein
VGFADKLEQIQEKDERESASLSSQGGAESDPNSVDLSDDGLFDNPGNHPALQGFDLGLMKQNEAL